jgi:hypothetical protein
LAIFAISCDFGDFYFLEIFAICAIFAIFFDFCDFCHISVFTIFASYAIFQIVVGPASYAIF